jgi:hypothetical protein
MREFLCLIAIAVLLVVLLDAFEVIILPRRVVRRVRLSRFFYQGSWFFWSRLAKRVKSGGRREGFLGFYGPLSLVFLIILWASAMMVAFGVIHWAVGPPGASFAHSLYLSGSTFITLGVESPHTHAARLVTVIEASMGFGFLGLVISYLPVLYQSFARRESNILLLDARAGSPPTAAELFRRYSTLHTLPELNRLLREWELWSADLLESYISYPVLAYFRSQHNNQSWLAALTTILDVCAVVLAGVDSLPKGQARLTFAMARHTVVDLAQIVHTPPQRPEPDRLPDTAVERFLAALTAAGIAVKDVPEFREKLTRLRRMYEPYVFALSRHLMIGMATWLRESERVDNWRTSAWEHSSSGLPRSLFDDGDDVHTV